MKSSPVSQPVRAWTETLTLPTYPALTPDPNPMFFDNRDIQRSKGNIYPAPFTDQLSSEKVDRPYQAIYLENEYLHIILLPELGGRIFAGLDKTNGYDFFYRHKVIKPALIGLLGPWISGGVEFNWPQHHRPSTFMPVESSIEERPDGSKTVWMGEHDPLNRTKGMVGITLYPGKAFVETKVRLYNRTPFPQTFLWWENAGVHIDEHYQVIFPPDVHYAQFHTKEFVTSYPIARGRYAGADYGEGADVSYWANSPNATSFFAAPSRYDFFGGYDHEKDAGIVHVANHHISPGKKFFTWGNGPFGHAWQRNLMDDTGEYLELMAGCYTDNQPDFSWIMPHETRTFSQFWYPVQRIGPMKNANLRAAVNLDVQDTSIILGVYATEPLLQAHVCLATCEGRLLDEIVDLAPGQPYRREYLLPEGCSESDLQLWVLDKHGREIIRYEPEQPWDGQMPEPYQPIPKPEQIKSVEELYLAGLHLEQYRHPVFPPEPYWQEALRRDPGDSRSNTALGRLWLRRGDFTRAEAYLRAAIQRLLARNPNPYDGEAHYLLGLTLKYQGRLDEACATLYKAVWNQAWQSSGYYTLAQIDCLRGDWPIALEHLEQALYLNNQHMQARSLKSAVLRRMDEPCQAGALVEETLALDPLDAWAQFEGYLAAEAAGKGELCSESLAHFREITYGDAQTLLDVAFDYIAAGLFEDAQTVLSDYTEALQNYSEIAEAVTPVYPMVAYTLGWLAARLDDKVSARIDYQDAGRARSAGCFPFRLEEMIILQDVVGKDLALVDESSQAHAHYYLGSLLYDKKQSASALEHWFTAAALDPALATAWRNLGLAAFNLDHDPHAAQQYLTRALEADPADPRLLLELDELLKRVACPPEERLDLLERHMDLVWRRDDLTLEWAALQNRLGRPEKAVEIMAARSFHPWEGGEGTVAGQYALAHLILARQALEHGRPQEVLDACQAGLSFPRNLGEVPWDPEIAPLATLAGQACQALELEEEAHKWFQRVLHLPAWGAVEYYQALALRGLGRETEAYQKLEALLTSAQAEIEREPEPNYFYQALPSPVFEDDLKRLAKIRGCYLAGLAHLGLGHAHEARAAFTETLALNPAHTLAWEEYRRL